MQFYSMQLAVASSSVGARPGGRTGVRHLSAAIVGFLLLITALATDARDLNRESRIEALRAKIQALLRSRPPAPVVPRTETAEERFGALLFSDKNLSLLRNQACESCHRLTPAVDPLTNKPLSTPGFVDNDNVQKGTAVSDGSVPRRFGNLNAPSVGYTAFSPHFHWDAVEGLYVGGQFWNGRAATLRDQAAQPFLNRVEMAMPSRWAVVTRLQENPRYREFMKDIYGVDLDRIPGRESAPADVVPPPGVFAAYDAMTAAIAAFEKTRVFNRFTSKFDYYLAGRTDLTEKERRGMDLFNGDKAKCSACHTSEPAIAPDGTVLPPLFSDFTYDNLGLPRNVDIPGNPEPNRGLGGRPDIAAKDPTGSEVGKHKVMSLRNVAVTAPYGHNGVFATLEQITHFYNTRDTLGAVADNNDPGFGTTGWPPPEIPVNVNRDELGDLGLTPEEESDLVAFMRTLTDNYPSWGRDPTVPPGTPSPFSETPFPPFP
jgi:cytochrome c peroxidase